MDFSTIDNVQGVIDMTPIHRWLRFRVTAMDAAAGTLTISAPTNGNSERSDGAAQAHGGAIATLIDTTATFACCVHLNKSVPTINMRIDFLRPAGGGEMAAHAFIRRAGRTIALIDVEVMAGGKLVAVGRCEQATGV
jgi:uncharacterized protein (TIGR00369 family)